MTSFPLTVNGGIRRIFSPLIAFSSIDHYALVDVNGLDDLAHKSKRYFSSEDQKNSTKSVVLFRAT